MIGQLVDSLVRLFATAWDSRKQNSRWAQNPQSPLFSLLIPVFGVTITMCSPVLLILIIIQIVVMFTFRLENSTPTSITSSGLLDKPSWLPCLLCFFLLGLGHTSAPDLLEAQFYQYVYLITTTNRECVLLPHTPFLSFARPPGGH